MVSNQLKGIVCKSNQFNLTFNLFILEILLHFHGRFALGLRNKAVVEEVGGHGNGSKKPVGAMRSHEVEHGWEHLCDNEDGQTGQACDHP